MTARGLAILFLFCSGLPAAEEYTYWVDPCTPEAARSTGCHSGDTELGAWAFDTWQRESNGALILKKSPTEAHARIRIRWANGTNALYGETQAVIVDGKPGAVIYVLPETEARPDSLLRDAVLYLTCLHESGHALGLKHTAQFADIMYSFQFGGDIDEYFNRYRRLLKARTDIPAHSGISDADRAALRAIFH